MPKSRSPIVLGLGECSCCGWTRVPTECGVFVQVPSAGYVSRPWKGSVRLPPRIKCRQFAQFVLICTASRRYAKRGLGNSDAETLPPELSHHGRLPSSVKGGAEDAMESSNLPPDMFTLFLHENYPPLFSKFEDIEVRGPCLCVHSSTFCLPVCHVSRLLPSTFRTRTC